MTVEFFEDPLKTRREMASDPHRPIYHFLPPRNWMNDPNGLFYWGGRYHLFYQFNPYGPRWGFIHWGHASSNDLVHWEDHPIALKPEKGVGDENGCWSGCLVDDGGRATALYTGFINPVNTPVMSATSQDPKLIHWQKNPHNPLISNIPEGVTETHFRDPYVWREEDRWKMVIGAGMQDGDSAALLYESSDLIKWDYRGPLFKERTFDSVNMWECPNFFPLGDQYVLLVSLYPDINGVYYYVGAYDGMRFTPHQQGFLEEGPFFYAPQVRQFDEQRQVMFAWLLEARSEKALEAAGWAGVQCMPRKLSLDRHDHLVTQPLAEMKTLRMRTHHMDEFSLAIGKGLPIGEGLHIGGRGKHLEIEVEVEAVAGRVGLGVLTSGDGREVTRISVDFDAREGVLDTSQSSLSNEVTSGEQCVHLSEEMLGCVKIHAFIDGSVIEVWFNDLISLTGRAYPTLANAAGLFMFAEGGEARVRSLKVWEMAAIWPREVESEP